MPGLGDTKPSVGGREGTTETLEATHRGASGNPLEGEHHGMTCKSLATGQEQEGSSTPEPGREAPACCSALSAPPTGKGNITPAVKERMFQHPAPASQSRAKKAGFGTVRQGTNQ